MPTRDAAFYDVGTAPEMGVPLKRSDEMMAIDALGATPTVSYAAVDKAKADQSKAAALLADDKQCKACPSTIKKGEKAVAEATAIARAA